MRTRRVRLHANWGADDDTREFFNRYSPRGDYRWRDLELTLSNDYEVLVIFNHPQHAIAASERAILFECETAPLRAIFEREFGHWIASVGRIYRTSEYFNFPGWSVPSPYRAVVQHPEKTRILSAVVSGKTWLPRQASRLAFVRGPLATLSLDHFGREVASGPNYRGPIADKGDALRPYRYTFAAENFCERNYFTEKIHDAIICECLAFYDGCPNLGDFLHPDTFVRIDVSNPDEALATIADTIRRDEWRIRLPEIQREKRRLMNELNPLEIIRKAVNGEPLGWPSPR